MITPCPTLARGAAVLALALITSLSAAADLPKVVLQTSMGEIALELDSERAPRTVENFLGYVDNGFYNGTLFHRVIEGFMIQGGGYDTSYTRKPTSAPIRNEADNGLRNTRYTISMARTSDPHSATAQFFINTVDNRNLDYTSSTVRGWGYAVFGRVIDGFDTVDRISETVTGRNGPFSRDAPKQAILIENASRLLPPEPPSPATVTDESIAGSEPTVNN